MTCQFQRNCPYVQEIFPKLFNFRNYKLQAGNFGSALSCSKQGE